MAKSFVNHQKDENLKTLKTHKKIAILFTVIQIVSIVHYFKNHIMKMP